MFDLEGKKVLITGASRGLGQVFAKILASAGADIGLFARSVEGLNATKKIVDDFGRQSLVLVGDITKKEQVDSVVSKCVQEFGRIDVLINNAGLNIRKPIEYFLDEDWHTVINTNLTGTFYFSRAVIPHMKKQKQGRIINIGSMIGLVALPERTAYAAAKSGVHGLTKALSLELASFNITVNAVAPGPCLTDINKVILENPEVNQFFLDNIPLNRWGKPEEIGPLILYLASDESSFMTGSIISIDGGWTAR